MGSQTAAGSSLAISATLPSTHDPIGYAALTFVEVGQIEKLGTFGAAFAKVEYQPLKGAKQKYKGSADYGALQPSIAIDSADAGQALMLVAADDESQKLYSFRVTLQDGAKRYFRGRVFGSPETADGADTMLLATPTVEICTRVVRVDAGVTPAPLPTLSQPSIGPASGTVGTTFTAVDGTVTNGTLTGRRWLLGTTAIGTGTTVVPNASGALTLENTAIGTNGATITSTSNAVTVSAAAPIPAPSLSLSSAVTQAEGNSGTAAFIWTLTLNRDGSTAAYPFNWAVTGSGANPADAADFGGALPSGSGTFAAGETSKSITVLVAGDTAVEPDNTFTLTVAANGLNTVTSTGTISNDDVAVGTPTIAFSNTTASVTEGNSGTSTVSNTINVTRNGVTGPLTINLTYGGTATSGTDYVAGPVSATIADGVNAASFDLTINGDTAVENDETIVINAALAGYAATASKTITVTNDDLSGGGTTPPLNITVADSYYEPEARTLFTAMDAVGTTPLTYATKYDMNRRVKRMKAGGIWDKLQWYVVASNLPQNEAQARINWKDPSKSLAKVGTPTWTATGGFASSAAGSNYTTDTALAVVNPDSFHIHAWTPATASPANAVLCGAQNSGGLGLQIIPSNTSTLMAARAMSASTNGAANTNNYNARGAHTVNRLGTEMAAGTVAFVRNGGRVETVTPASAPAAINDPALLSLAGATGNASTTASTVGVYSHGLGLTRDQEDLLSALSNDIAGPAVRGKPVMYDVGIGGNLQVDVAVLGTSLSAIVAAYEAKRQNPNLVVAIFGDEDQTQAWHLGGHVSQNLGWSDVYNGAIYSGTPWDMVRWIKEVFYSGSSPNRTAGFSNQFQTGTTAEGRAWNAACRRMLDPKQTSGLIPGLDIPVFWDKGYTSAAVSNGAITSFTTAAGRTVQAKVVIGNDYSGIFPKLPAFRQSRDRRQPAQGRRLTAGSTRPTTCRWSKALTSRSARIKSPVTLRADLFAV